MHFKVALAQDSSGKLISISGEIIGTAMENDSIHFISTRIGKKYYQRDIPSVKIVDNKFNVKAKLSYPHLFHIVFESDKGIVTSRGGPFYIDNSTSSMKVDYSSAACSQVNGRAFEEYQNKFIPFFFASMIS